MWYMAADTQIDTHTDRHTEIQTDRQTPALHYLLTYKYTCIHAYILALFNTIVLPHLDYCSTAWNSCSVSQIVKLQRLKNRGMRIILSCKSITRMYNMLTTLKWLSIRQRLMLHKCVLMHKIVNSITPQYMANVAVGITHNYNTRSKSNANLSRSHHHVESLSSKGTIL